MSIGVVSNQPPYTSMHVQHVEGGFLCVVPPGYPMVSPDSSGVAFAMHQFLGVPSGSSSAPEDDSVEYQWPDATVIRGSVFNVSKVARAKKGREVVPDGGFMLGYHMATPESQTQVAAFNRATVMDQLRKWITTPLPPEAPTKALLTLEGMCVNSDMDTDDDTVFVMQVLHASQPTNFNGPCFVARCDDPKMAIGVADEEVVGYLAEELGQDLQGLFAVRVHELFLEFGPRIDSE